MLKQKVAMRTEPEYVPSDFSSPDWSRCTQIHDWKNYISDSMRAMWDAFSEPQKSAIAANAWGYADREDWD
jgi:hypothetical protein